MWAHSIRNGAELCGGEFLSLFMFSFCFSVVVNTTVVIGSLGRSSEESGAAEVAVESQFLRRRRS